MGDDKKVKVKKNKIDYSAIRKAEKDSQKDKSTHVYERVEKAKSSKVKPPKSLKSKTKVATLSKKDMERRPKFEK